MARPSERTKTTAALTAHCRHAAMGSSTCQPSVPSWRSSALASEPTSSGIAPACSKVATVINPARRVGNKDSPTSTTASHAATYSPDTTNVRCWRCSSLPSICCHTERAERAAAKCTRGLNNHAGRCSSSPRPSMASRRMNSRHIRSALSTTTASIVCTKISRIRAFACASVAASPYSHGTAAWLPITITLERAMVNTQPASALRVSSVRHGVSSTPPKTGSTVASTRPVGERSGHARATARGVRP